MINNVEFAEIMKMEVDYLVETIVVDYFDLIHKNSTRNAISMSLAACYAQISNVFDQDIPAEEKEEALTVFFRINFEWTAKIITDLNKQEECRDFRFWYTNQALRIIGDERIMII